MLLKENDAVQKSNLASKILSNYNNLKYVYIFYKSSNLIQEKKDIIFNVFMTKNSGKIEHANSLKSWDTRFSGRYVRKSVA